MKIEHLLVQGSGKMNEDALFTGERRFGVFDGATSFNGFADEFGRTGGHLASTIANAVFEKSTRSLAETAAIANEKIGEIMAMAGINRKVKEDLWCSTMAVVEIADDAKSFSWAQMTDSLILVINRDGTHRLLVADYDHDLETSMKWKELADQGVTNLKEVLHDQFVKVRRASNVAYGVLNGEPEAMKFLNIGEESLESVAHILVFTDGFIPPKEDPSAPDDFDAVVRAFQSGGLEAVKSYVRELEDGDPGCVKMPRYKKSDDIAAIAISFVD